MITLGWLKERGHLKPHCRTEGRLSWSRLGKPSGNIIVSTDLDNKYVEFRYTSSGRPIDYRINLVSLPSNLGIGEVWYFICPITTKRCRTLYEYGDYFYSRLAFDSPIYSSQIESKNIRGWQRSMRTLSLRDEFLAKKYSRTLYNGKFTRRYERILRRENKLDYGPVRRMLDSMTKTLQNLTL